MSLFIRFMMFLGFAFLYIPLILIILFSFNSSKIATNWERFSTKWYYYLAEDKEMIQGLITSIKVASYSATIAIILGVLAAIILTKLRNFRGQTLFISMITFPFIMPEVVTGFSLLLLFINLEKFLGWPENLDIKTIILAHSTLGMAYVTNLIQTRLSVINSDIEEAAADLGAKPIKIFFLIILPVISPTVIAAWLLAFTLSFDDLILASFVSGPSSSTLPMLIYSRIRLGVNPEINALATITILMISLITSFAIPVIIRKNLDKNGKNY